MKINQDREEILTLTEEGKIFIWNYFLSTRHEFDIRVLIRRHISSATGIGYIFAFSKEEMNPFVTMALDKRGDLQVWNYKTGESIHTFTSTDQEVTSLAMSGNTIILTEKSGQIIMYDMKTKTETHRMNLRLIFGTADIQKLIVDDVTGSLVAGIFLLDNQGFLWDYSPFYR